MADPFEDIREAVRRLCADFPGPYWQAKDRERAYPTEFVRTLTEAGFLSVLIPEEFGGSGLGLGAATALLEEIHRSGGNGGACHAQMYVMGTLLKHGSAAQKAQYLPMVATGELRLQAFGVTEPTAGTDTTRIRTFARRDGDDYVVTGQKIWISRAEHSDLMVLLVRTTPREQCAKSSDGMSVLLVDMREAVGNGLTIRPIRTMLNHATTELFFDDLRVPAANLIGEEGNGFRYILSGMNAERILIASECIGDGRFFIDRASAYASERNVFGRAIGENQGVQFPIARAHVQLSAAALMVDKAAALFDAGEPCGTEANMAKMLASEASWYAADMCVQTHGGFGFAEEYDIERKFRETRLYQVAPISTNLILSHVATHVLNLPKSFLMKITAAVLDAIGHRGPLADGRPLTLGEIELAQPRPGELLVRIDAAGLCHSDLSVINGDRPRPMPMALGHEAVATVEALGDEHDKLFAIGDRVVLAFLPACGECVRCVSGQGYMCPNGAAANGKGELLGGGFRLSRDGGHVHHHLGVSAFATHAVIDRRSAVKIDADVPVEIAALFGCAVLTGVGAVLNSAALEPGESVAIYGLGGVGLAALIGAVAGGGNPVTAIDPVAEKRALALELGAASAFAPGEEDGITPPDLVVETVGKAAVLERAYALARRGGRVVTVGLPNPAERFSIPAVSLVGDGKTIIGSYLGSSIPARDIPRYIGLWRAGRLPVERLLTSVSPMRDINRLFDTLASGHAVRQVVIPEQHD